jgi:hypothetical protein
VWGSEDQVFAALRAAFRTAQLQGPAVMNATLAAGMPGDELVGEIQHEVNTETGGDGVIGSQHKRS